MGIDVKGFRAEYKAWTSNTISHNQRRNLPKTRADMDELVDVYPKDAAKMLTMYKELCGPIGL